MSINGPDSETVTLTGRYVKYSPEVEKIEPDEQETIQKIIEAMFRGGDLTRQKYGKSVRTSHAKAHGILRGELRVQDGLPPFLRQGLFATAKTYDVIARLSQVPGDLDDDRKVSTPRGFAFNANVEWPEDESPYQTVGKLIFPPQDAWSPGRQVSIEEGLSFCPAHSLAAHRPLGSIMRARMQAYKALGRARREQNGCPAGEPRTVNELLD